MIWLYIDRRNLKVNHKVVNVKTSLTNFGTGSDPVDGKIFVWRAVTFLHHSPNKLFLESGQNQIYFVKTLLTRISPNKFQTGLRGIQILTKL
jgi:hypothetical protein